MLPSLETDCNIITLLANCPSGITRRGTLEKGRAGALPPTILHRRHLPGAGCVREKLALPFTPSPSASPLQ